MRLGRLGFRSVLRSGRGTGGSGGAPAPTLTATPQSGPWRATSKTFAGTNLTGCTGVTINGVACTGVSSTSTSVTVTTPVFASNGGPYNVVVTTPSGNSGSTGNGIYSVNDPQGTTLIAWWEFDSSSSFANTSGTTPATNGGALAFVKDQRGGSNPHLAALVGSTGCTITPNPMTWGSADADNGAGYAQGPASQSDEFLISQTSLTYDGVVMVVKAASSQWDAQYDAFFDDSADTTAKTFAIGNKLNSTLIDLNTLGLTIQSPGIFYAENGAFGATIDATYSQAGGLDEYHVIAWRLPSARSGFPVIANGWDVHLNFSGRIQAVIMTNGTDLTRILQKQHRLRA